MEMKSQLHPQLSYIKAYRMEEQEIFFSVKYVLYLFIIIVVVIVFIISNLISF